MKSVRDPNYIFVLIGDCRVGKTTLLGIAATELKMRIRIIKSVTTREPRNESDKRDYIHISKRSFEEKIGSGDFAECVRYPPEGENWNYYGYERAYLENTLRQRHGICIATQEGALALMEQGYKVKPTRIIGKGNKEIQDAFYEQYPERKAEDEQRNVIEIPYALTIVNDFAPGGLEKAAKELCTFIRRHK